MSQTELHVGKLVRVAKINETETPEEMAQRLVIQHGITTEEYTNNIEAICYEFYPQKYVLYNENLYEVIGEAVEDGGDIYKARINQDGSINYTLQYYNGGQSFTGAMEEALKNIK